MPEGQPHKEEDQNISNSTVRSREDSDQSHFLWSHIKDKGIILLTGSGGVGKTTITAAIALYAALEGKKVLAVTVDPARRLANSLGIRQTGNVEIQVSLETLSEKKSGLGELWVMMLDIKKTLDELVEKYAPSSVIADKIMNNTIYRTASDSLSGTEEIVALGKLYELQKKGKFDMIVVDTAPTQHAIDFFESPVRLMNILDMSILQWFLKPIDMLQKISFSLFRRSKSLIFERIEKSLGISFFSEIASFVQNFEGMFESLKERAISINTILKDPHYSALGVVTGPGATSVAMAEYLTTRLLELQMPLQFMIVNRIHPLYHIPEHEKSALRNFIETNYLRDTMLTYFNESIDGNSEYSPELLYNLMKETMKIALPYAESDLNNLSLLKKNTKQMLPIFSVPYLEKDISTIDSLMQVNSFLHDTPSL